MQQLQELIEPKMIPASAITGLQPAAIEPSPWYVMLTEPQQDLTTVWRLHELGLEMFVPVIRKRVKTGRIGRNGQKTTRIIAKPMFPGYGFLRRVADDDVPSIRNVRGVRDFMRTARGEFIELPHAAVLAVFRKQMQEHYEFLNRSQFRRGDVVRIDADGGAYAGLVATVDKIDSKGRIEVLLGMIRHTLPVGMVVAA